MWFSSNLKSKLYVVVAVAVDAENENENETNNNNAIQIECARTSIPVCGIQIWPLEHWRSLKLGCVVAVAVVVNNITIRYHCATSN